MKRLIKTITLAGFLVLTPGLLHAEEGGAGHYTPGGAATLIDLLPTKPGFILQPIYLYYKGDAEASRTYPVAGKITANLHATSNAFTLGALYTLAPRVLGAHYTVGVYVPYVWKDVTANVSTVLGSIRREDKVDGFGDITLIPAGLAWKAGNWQFGGLLPIYAPTGSYDVGRLANPGFNYWTVDPTVQLAYNSEKSGFNAALFAGMTFNTENNDTHYQSGSVVHVEASVQQLLPLGPGFIGLGANAYLYEQVTADSGSGAVLGDFEDRSMGIGPVIDYILSFKNGSLLAAEFKWLPELDTKNTLDGNYYWLKIAYKFW
jgi:hypothetical protein